MKTSYLFVFKKISVDNPKFYYWVYEVDNSPSVNFPGRLNFPGRYSDVICVKIIDADAISGLNSTIIPIRKNIWVYTDAKKYDKDINDFLNSHWTLITYIDLHTLLAEHFEKFL